MGDCQKSYNICDIFSIIIEKKTYIIKRFKMSQTDNGMRYKNNIHFKTLNLCL